MAVIEALEFADTAMLDTRKVAEVLPAATVTLAPTVATAVFELLRETTAPPVGAADFSVTVPVEELPPVTLVGDRVTELIGLLAPNATPMERQVAATAQNVIHLFIFAVVLLNGPPLNTGDSLTSRVDPKWLITFRIRGMNGEA